MSNCPHTYGSCSKCNPPQTQPSEWLDEQLDVLWNSGYNAGVYNGRRKEADKIDFWSNPTEKDQYKQAIKAHIDEAVNEAKQEIADQIYIRLGGHRDYMSNNSVDSFQALAAELQSKSKVDV